MGLTGRIVCGFEVIYLKKKWLDNVFFLYIYINILVSTFCETKKVVECVFLDRSGELCYSHISDIICVITHSHDHD